jgi:nitrite reductase/ring-hydroxylating ferredoxin subunit
MSPDHSEKGRNRDFGTFLLNAVLGVVFLIALAIAVIYTVPPEHLIIPQHEVAVRVARVEDFTVGSSRMETWGEQAILVVRTGESVYSAVQGASPVDGCLLEWDAESMRVNSPCGHQLYDLRGQAVEGLTTEPLQRYEVFVRDGVVYVTRD